MTTFCDSLSGNGFIPSVIRPLNESLSYGWSVWGRGDEKFWGLYG
jgi:hypothetical protein